MPDPARQQSTVPLVALVIDDLGPDAAMARRVESLPAPVNAAFLPGTAGLAGQVARVRDAGHEILAHVPMEPLPRRGIGAADGPASAAARRRWEKVFALLEGEAEGVDADALRVADAAPVIRRRLDRALAGIDGCVGISNHRGSRFTADRVGMRVVMEELRRRNLLYLDSRTTTATVGAALAREVGVAYAARDIFLDRRDDAGAIRARLADVERFARRRGAVVAIGHARRTTLDEIEAWLPVAIGRGLRLVPVSEIAGRVRSRETA